ncbi:hypothetical protein E1200_19500 [Actinomadura sp. GC306]|nr:hypothetical protein E1200_19500 [Actinomadura sp. GC306]
MAAGPGGLAGRPAAQHEPVRAAGSALDEQRVVGMCRSAGKRPDRTDLGTLAEALLDPAQGGGGGRAAGREAGSLCVGHLIHVNGFR